MFCFRSAYPENDSAGINQYVLTIFRENVIYQDFPDFASEKRKKKSVEQLLWFIKRYLFRLTELYKDQDINFRLPLTIMCVLVMMHRPKKCLNIYGPVFIFEYVIFWTVRPQSANINN